MTDASEIAKALTAAWIRTEGTNKSAAETAEFYRTIYHELISKTEHARRSGGESIRFDRYDAASLLVLAAAEALILLPVLLT
jgi:hypothetical protein